MSKKKNGFREWLSDNLRYVILGFAMLVIVALLYIGFYLLVSLVAGTQLKDAQAIENEQESDLSDDNLLGDTNADVESEDEHNAVDDESESSDTSQNEGSEDESSEDESSEEDTAESNTQE